MQPYMWHAYGRSGIPITFREILKDPDRFWAIAMDYSTNNSNSSEITRDSETLFGGIILVS